MSSRVSIIIRGKNEEDWLGLCLRSISMQTYKNFEVIYIDNDSKDASIKIAQEYKFTKIKKIKKFLPGNAINIGIRASKGKYIVILSAHCIPTNKYWLTQLVSSIKSKSLAGVYGRQLPLESTSSDDARDLLITFGSEDRIQEKDSFFHNANSIIKREVWEKINFDNKISNIEDRDWAKKVLDIGYKVKYDASAAVYHFHGLHQHNNYESFRASAVNSLIQKINEDEKNDLPEWFDVSSRICPVVLYGKNVSKVEAQVNKLIRHNPQIVIEDLFYYGECDPKMKGLKFIKRNVSTKVAFNKFTLDALNVLNKKIGFKVEAVCFVDLSYKNFIPNCISINKETVFSKGTHLSTFAFKDKGDIWISNNKKISKVSKMFDKDTSFLRVVIGQGAVMRSSLIRIKGSDPKDGYTHTFRDIKYLLR